MFLQDFFPSGFFPDSFFPKVVSDLELPVIFVHIWPREGTRFQVDGSTVPFYVLGNSGYIPIDIKALAKVFNIKATDVQFMFNSLPKEFNIKATDVQFMLNSLPKEFNIKSIGSQLVFNSLPKEFFIDNVNTVMYVRPELSKD